MTWWQWLILWIIFLIVFVPIIGRRLKTASLPGCFGSNPGPQQRAENDCLHCEWNDLCLRGPARFTKEELENR